MSPNVPMLMFRSRAPGARPAMVNGSPSFVAFSGDRPFAVAGFEFRGDLISEIYILADPQRLAKLDYSVLEATRRP